MTKDVARLNSFSFITLLTRGRLVDDCCGIANVYIENFEVRVGRNKALFIDYVDSLGGRWGGRIHVGGGGELLANCSR